jgi:hypothetical protein
MNPYRSSTEPKPARKSSIVSYGSTSRSRSKAGTPSYADIITNAILSSTDKRLSLAEIYDWMVKNVEGLEDQRHLHSSKGWKNAVRHTLSINQRFKKVTRIGRPGWWTVEWPRTEQKRDSTVNYDANWTAGIVPFDPTTTPTMEVFRERSGSEPSRYFPHFPHGANFRDCGASAPVSPSPYQNDAFRGVQHVQVWRDDGTLGVVTVPSPVQCRNTVCNDASTQTEETITQNPVGRCAHLETQYEANCAFSNTHYDNNCEHSRPQYDSIRTQYDSSCAHSSGQFDKKTVQDNKSSSLEFAPSLTNSPYHMLSTIVDDDWILSSYDNVFLSNWCHNIT